MLQRHSSHNVLKDLLHDFDELGVELGHGRSSRWPSTTAGSAIPTFWEAAVESTIRDRSFSTELGCLRQVAASRKNGSVRERALLMLNSSSPPRVSGSRPQSCSRR